MSGSHRIAWHSLLVLVFLVPLAVSRFALIGIQVPFTFDQFDLVKTFVLRAREVLERALESFPGDPRVLEALSVDEEGGE